MRLAWRRNALAMASGAAFTTERHAAILRLIILFAILPLLWWDVVPPESEIALTGLSALIAAYILVTLVVIPRLPRAPRQDLVLTLDILAAAALVQFTGGIHSTLLPLLYLPLLAAAVRLNLRHTLLTAVAVTAIVVWMWSVAEGGLPSLGPIAARVSLFTFGSLFVALFFGTLTQENRLSQERAALNEVLDRKLAEATAQLRARLAELEFSYALSGRLARAADTAAVIDLIAEAAAQQLTAPHSAVFLYEHLGGSLSLAATRAIDADEAAPIMHTCVEYLRQGNAAPMIIEAPGGTRWKHGICVPIVAGSRLLGAVCAGGSEEWRLPQALPLGALANIADQGGIALERRRLLEDLGRLALTDAGARLHPREQFDRILHDEVRRAGQLGATFILTKVRIAEIEEIAARLGARTADLLLKRAASLIVETVRRVDVVTEGARGEFFVLLPMMDVDAARGLAATMRQRLREDAPAARLLGAPSGPGAIIGLAAFPGSATSGPELYVRVQEALEAAEASGGIEAAELTGGPLSSNSTARGWSNKIS